MDLSTFWMLFSLGSLPSNLSGTIPAGTPSGIEIVFQGLAVEPAMRSGNLSNLGAVTTRTP